MLTRKSTARTLLIGPILDSSGAAVTTEVVGSLRVTKNGTVSTLNASATLTHDHSGMYRLALTTSDTDTVGVCQISLTSGTNAMGPVDLTVVETAVYDALFAASAAGYQVPIWAAANSTVALTGTTIAPTQKVDVETIKTQGVTCAAAVTVSPYVGSTGAAVDGTTVNTLASHDPGATLGTSTYAGADTSGTTTLLSRIVGTLASGTHNPQSGDAYARMGAPAGVSVSADVASVKADTTTLLSRITSTLFAGITYLARWLGAIAGKTADSSTLAEIQATTAGASYNNTTDSLEAQKDSYTAPLDAAGTRAALGMTAADLDTQLDAILANTGSGAYTRTITVNDGTTALQGAKVRLTQGAESYVGTTNASGQVVFAVDAATWSVAITKANYSFTPTTLVVSASGSTTYSMTASGPTPSSDPDTTAVRITTRGADTEPEASKTIQLRQVTIPSGDTGNAFDGDWATYTTDANGIVDVTLLSGAEYALRRGAAGPITRFTPTGASYAVSSVVGKSA